MAEKGKKTKGFELDADVYDSINEIINRAPGETQGEKLVNMAKAFNRQMGIVQPIDAVRDRLTPLFDRFMDVVTAELELRDNTIETLRSDREKERVVQEAKEKEWENKCTAVTEQLHRVQDENTALKKALAKTQQRLEAAETLCRNQQDVLQSNQQMDAFTRMMEHYSDQITKFNEELTRQKSNHENSDA